MRSFLICGLTAAADGTDDEQLFSHIKATGPEGDDEVALVTPDGDSDNSASDDDGEIGEFDE